MGINSSISNAQYVTTEVCPIGGVIAYPATTIPNGWLECNGANISRTDFADLFAKIGTTFGVGDGSTTFTLPDLRGEFIRGFDNTRGVDTGRTLGSSQSDAYKAHTHTGGGCPSSLRHASPSSGGSSTTAGLVNNTVTSGVDESGDIETRPRNVALVYIIKAKNLLTVALPAYDATTVGGLSANSFVLQSAYNGAFDSSKVSTGYQKLPSGLIIQWGTSTSISDDTQTTLTFPITFPNSCLNVMATMLNSSTSNDDIFARVVSFTTTSSVVRAERTSSSTSGTRYIQYLAIGY